MPADRDPGLEAAEVLDRPERGGTPSAPELRRTSPPDRGPFRPIRPTSRHLLCQEHGGPR